MNNLKIRRAFEKVKEDIYALDFKIKTGIDEINLKINQINKNLDSLKEVSKLNDEIKKQIKDLKSMNIDKFTDEMIRNFNYIKKVNEDLNHKLESFHMQFNDLREKIDKFSKITQSNSDNINMILKKINATESLFNEKVNLEISNLKIEVFTELSKLRKEIEKKSKSKKVK